MWFILHYFKYTVVSMLSAPPFKHRWMMFLLCHGVVHNNCNRSDLHLQLHSTTHQKRKKKLHHQNPGVTKYNLDFSNETEFIYRSVFFGGCLTSDPTKYNFKLICRKSFQHNTRNNSSTSSHLYKGRM